MLIQQGDVLFLQVNNLPVGGEKKETDVIVEGEFTGHAHRIDRRADQLSAFLYLVAGTLYLKNLEMCRVVHEEHNTVELPPGVWQIGRVREYDHFGEEAKMVRD